MWTVSVLNKQHDRKSFDCGNKDLNQYFKEIVSQDIRNKLTKCYVVTEKDSSKVLAFFTLSATSIPTITLGDKIKRRHYPEIPCVLLGRLALDVSFQGNGNGSKVLGAVIRIAENLPIGTACIIVEPKTEELCDFYTKNGFVRLPNSNKYQCVFIL